ncbi:MAG: hypothetical protein AN484_27340, partial [Aphanizomenon flos-aquae WA102]
WCVRVCVSRGIQGSTDMMLVVETGTKIQGAGSGAWVLESGQHARGCAKAGEGQDSMEVTVCSRQ